MLWHLHEDWSACGSLDSEFWRLVSLDFIIRSPSVNRISCPFRNLSIWRSIPITLCLSIQPWGIKAQPSKHLVTIWWQAVIPKLQIRLNTRSYGGDIGHPKRSQRTFPPNVNFAWKWKMAHMKDQGQMLWVMSCIKAQGLLWGMTWKLSPAFSSSSACQHTTEFP